MTRKKKNLSTAESSLELLLKARSLTAIAEEMAILEGWKNFTEIPPDQSTHYYSLAAAALRGLTKLVNTPSFPRL